MSRLLACTTSTESGEMARKASCSECCGGGGSLEAARGKAAAAEEEVAMTAGAEVRRALPLEGAVWEQTYVTSAVRERGSR